MAVVPTPASPAALALIADQPGYVSGRYYARTLGTASSTILATENRLYFSPVLVPSFATIDRIAANITTGAGDAQYQLKFGIYSNLNGRPNALLLDAGFLTQGVGNGAAEATVAVGLIGWNWLCMIGNRNAGATGTQATFRGFTNESRTDLVQLVGASTPDGIVTESLVAAYNDQVIGTWASYALPAVAPTLTLAATVAPALSFRKA